MKSWLTKFRISAALDAGKPLPQSLRQRIATDPELERFTRRTEALGRALRSVPPAAPSQRDSIMRAVGAAARQEQPRRALAPSWLAASAAVAALAVMLLWTAFHRPASPGPQSLDGAVMVLQMSEQMPDAMPRMVMAPLSDEWARVDRDLKDTTQVLLASFP
jgi:ferric-dicitrate binding protein FerR (iron transport regulator)